MADLIQFFLKMCPAAALHPQRRGAGAAACAMAALLLGASASAGAASCSQSAYAFSLCDEFNGAALDTTVWKQISASRGDGTVGATSSVHDGYLDLAMNQTDNGGAVVTRFAAQRHLKVTLTHHMHPGGSYFMPAVLLESGAGQYVAQVSWLRSNHAPDYCSRTGAFDRVRLTVDHTADWCTSAVFSSVSSSGYYNRWTTAVIDYDMDSGRVAVDLDGNGSVDLQGTVPAGQRQAVTGVSVQPFGWYTGHWHRVDSIRVEGTPLDAGPVIDRVTPARATYGVPTVFSVQGRGLAAGMGFTVGDCERSNDEMEGGTATERWFRCTPFGAVGSKNGWVKTAPGGSALHAFQVEVVQKTLPKVFINTNQSRYASGDTLQLYLSAYAAALTDAYDLYLQFDGPGFTAYHTTSGLLSQPAPLLQNVRVADLAWIDWMTLNIVPQTPLGDYTAHLFLVDAASGQLAAQGTAAFSTDAAAAAPHAARAPALEPPAPQSVPAAAPPVGRAASQAPSCTLGGIKTAAVGSGALSRINKFAMKALQMGAQFYPDTALVTLYAGAEGAYNLLEKGEELCEHLDTLESVMSRYDAYEADAALTPEQRSDLFAIDLLLDLFGDTSASAFRGDLYGVALKNLKNGVRDYYNALNRNANAAAILNEGWVNVSLTFSRAKPCWYCRRKDAVNLNVQLTPVFTYEVDQAGYALPISQFPKRFTTAATVSGERIAGSGAVSSNGGRLSFQVKAGLYLIKASTADGREVFRDTAYFDRDGSKKTMAIVR